MQGTFRREPVKQPRPQFWWDVCWGTIKGKVDPISAETLVGRWRAVTKDDADEGNTTRDARGPTGETIAFRYEFRADHTFETSVEIQGGLQAKLIPQLAGKHAVRGKWRVVEVGRNTLTIEFPDSKLTRAGFPAPRAKWSSRRRTGACWTQMARTPWCLPGFLERQERMAAS